MDRYRVYKWLEKQKGMVTMEELVAHFRDVDAIEIAEGFSQFIDKQLDGE